MMEKTIEFTQEELDFRKSNAQTYNSGNVAEAYNQSSEFYKNNSESKKSKKKSKKCHARILLL